MLTFVSLPIELLRAKPRLVLGCAVAAQAALWTLVPSLLFWSPPGGLAETLAVGREHLLGSPFGPPLSFWLAEAADRVGGMFAVYLWAQLCVVAAIFLVFEIGRRMVGERHAAIGALLLAGVAAITVGSVEFGPSVLAMPLWALTLLHLWMVLGEGRRLTWLLLGIDFGLLLLTSYAAVALIACVLLFALATRRGRADFASIEPWLGFGIAAMVFFPHLIWLDRVGGHALANLAEVADAGRVWARRIGLLVLGHAGLVLLVVLAMGIPFMRRGHAPTVDRPPPMPLSRPFVWFFAVAPMVAVAALMLLADGMRHWIAGPLAILSGLAVVLLAGDAIRVVHQRLIAWALAGLIALPPLLTALAALATPWLRIELPVAQPAGAIGRFFGDVFQQRTGRALTIVAGDPRTASLVALGSPGRPSLFLDATPEHSPWVTDADVSRRGALLVWPVTDTRGLPPAALRERFPALVPEPPQTFARPIEGRLPPLRIGWALIPPASPK